MLENLLKIWYDKSTKIKEDVYMKDKALNKKLEHYCEYCVYGTCSDFSNEVLCLKRGITDRKDSCRRYKYDPLKRDPNRAKISKNYSGEDFVL